MDAPSFAHRESGALSIAHGKRVRVFSCCRTTTLYMAAVAVPLLPGPCHVLEQSSLDAAARRPVPVRSEGCGSHLTMARWRPPRCGMHPYAAALSDRFAAACPSCPSLSALCAPRPPLSPPPSTLPPLALDLPLPLSLPLTWTTLVTMCPRLCICMASSLCGARGFACQDTFDMLNTCAAGTQRRLVAERLPPIRLLVPFQHLGS